MERRRPTCSGRILASTADTGADVRADWDLFRSAPLRRENGDNQGLAFVERGRRCLRFEWWRAARAKIATTSTSAAGMTKLVSGNAYMFLMIRNVPPAAVTAAGAAC